MNNVIYYYDYRILNFKIKNNFVSLLLVNKHIFCNVFDLKIMLSRKKSVKHSGRLKI